MEELIQALESITKSIHHFFNQLVISLLDFLESARRWLSLVINRIYDYLAQLIKALSKLGIVLIRLSLFYIPGIILIAIGSFGHINWVLILGVIYCVFITVVGLTYRKK